MPRKRKKKPTHAERLKQLARQSLMQLEPTNGQMAAPPIQDDSFPIPEIEDEYGNLLLDPNCQPISRKKAKADMIKANQKALDEWTAVWQSLWTPQRHEEFKSIATRFAQWHFTPKQKRQLHAFIKTIERRHAQPEQKAPANPQNNTHQQRQQERIPQLQEYIEQKTIKLTRTTEPTAQQLIRQQLQIANDELAKAMGSAGQPR